MNVEEKLTAMRDLIQEDVGNRGLRRDPDSNLITACPEDFANACRSIAETPEATVKIITGFLIPDAKPPCAETDGPLGAVFLARVFVSLGIKVILETDAFCVKPLEVGLAKCGLTNDVPIWGFPADEPSSYWRITHLIALERCGPSQQNRYHTMRGLDVTEHMSPAHALFEIAKRRAPAITTIGIGDGGNEIGMGKIPWDVIRRNIPNGGLIACRVPTDYLIVAGVSNWGAYALAAGVALLKGRPLDRRFCDVEREREILRVMVEDGPLVDGVTGKPTVSVDGLTFKEYVKPLRRLAMLCE